MLWERQKLAPLECQAPCFWGSVWVILSPALHLLHPKALARMPQLCASCVSPTWPQRFRCTTRGWFFSPSFCTKTKRMCRFTSTWFGCGQVSSFVDKGRKFPLPCSEQQGIEAQHGPFFNFLTIFSEQTSNLTYHHSTQKMELPYSCSESHLAILKTLWLPDQLFVGLIFENTKVCLRTPIPLSKVKSFCCEAPNWMGHSSEWHQGPATRHHVAILTRGARYPP